MQGQAAPAALPASSLKARRFAIRASPEPSIFLEYEDPDGKRRVRAVKLVNVNPNTDVDRLTRKVIRSFPRRLDAGTVKYEQVRKLVFRLIESIRQQGTASTGDTQKKPGSLDVGGAGPEGPALHPSLSPKIDHPQVARLQGSENGSGMRHSSESRFSTSTASLHEEGHNGVLDELDDMLGELDRELDMAPVAARVHPSQPQDYTNGSTGTKHAAQAPLYVEGARTSDSGLTGRTSGTSDKRESYSGRSRFAQEADPVQDGGDELVLDLDMPEDLNKVTDVELQMAKKRMEQDFLKNQIKPGHAAYEYDKQVDFAAPTAENEWDESGDEDEEGEG